MSVSPKVSCKSGRFRPRFRTVQTSSTCKFQKASDGSGTVQRGSAYSRLHYRCIATTHFKPGSAKTLKASLEPSVVNAHHNPSPPIQGYIILASHPHISKRDPPKPLRLPWNRPWSMRITTPAHLFKATSSLHRIHTFQSGVYQNP